MKKRITKCLHIYIWDFWLAIQYLTTHKIQFSIEIPCKIFEMRMLKKYNLKKWLHSSDEIIWNRMNVEFILHMTHCIYHRTTAMNDITYRSRYRKVDQEVNWKTRLHIGCTKKSKKTKTLNVHSSINFIRLIYTKSSGIKHIWPLNNNPKKFRMFMQLI